MNYIRHLQLVYQQFMEDERLNPSHISLYMAIFQEWNSARFRNLDITAVLGNWMFLDISSICPRIIPIREVG